MVDALKGPVDCEPLVARLPLHPPDALHEVALLEDQLNVEAAPLVTLVGLAVNVTVGAGGGGSATVTLAEALTLPPAPVQVNVYVVVALKGPVDCEPDVARLPPHPTEALHEVALVDDQVSVEEEPLATPVGLAVSVTVGAGGAVTATLADALAVPPAPPQVNV